MHLHHPSLSLNGKKRGKIKFRNADEARKARDLDTEWRELQKRWGVETEEKKRNRALKSEVYVPPKDLSRRETDIEKVRSLNTGLGVAPLAPAKVYTGTKVKGIATMHKSNAVPVFSDEEAVDIAKMRR
jgi:hypothetical protein